MKYDFTSILDRRDKDAISVDYIPIKGAEVKEGFDRIPMWIADMNFPTAPSITEKMAERLAHPSFGYFMPRKEYYDAIINWQKERNGVEGLTKEDIGYENGVLGCLASAMQTFTLPGERILLNSPMYIGFGRVLESNGRVPVLSPLKLDEDGVWRLDYDDMDKKIRENDIHFVIFCTPHNPAGRVWKREELEQAMEVFKKNDCIVFSDEIWSDLILEGHKHIPLQSLSDDARNRVIAAYAPSKTFSLAGLVGSYHIIYNKALRDRMDRQSVATHYNSMNVLSMYALIGAYEPAGAEWLDELIEVLTGNVDFACDFIYERFSGVKVSKPEGTYMLYLDVSGWLEEHGMTEDELLAKGVSVGVIWQDGRPFKFDNTIRMNLALPRSRVEEAFRRLDEYVFNA
ncbi:MAG: aminotransferase class I/II-fold pyridoxal phosphate-dependent enzyme [Eubacteriales bacterium]|nr:aminotransferase class I/II-fold pyridoxal phosphate-dependent enzyme [Eubacteriales bacterium]